MAARNRSAYLADWTNIQLQYGVVSVIEAVVEHTGASAGLMQAWSSSYT
jgi:hypothetical protein